MKKIYLFLTMLCMALGVYAQPAFEIKEGHWWCSHADPANVTIINVQEGHLAEALAELRDSNLPHIQNCRNHKILRISTGNSNSPTVTLNAADIAALNSLDNFGFEPSTCKMCSISLTASRLPSPSATDRWRTWYFPTTGRKKKWRSSDHNWLKYRLCHQLGKERIGWAYYDRSCWERQHTYWSSQSSVYWRNPQFENRSTRSIHSHYGEFASSLSIRSPSCPWPL